jgi:predicted  nucleic acid-binding Zn-ribbon protein
MACLDHVCVACGYGWMDNHVYYGGCPKCGERVTNDFDEDLRDHYDEDRDPGDAPLGGGDDEP